MRLEPLPPLKPTYQPTLGSRRLADACRLRPDPAQPEPLRHENPGEILREDYLVPLGLTVNALLIALSGPATRIREILKECRAVTEDMAARVAKQFGGDAASGLALQANFDLKTLQDIER